MDEAYKMTIKPITADDIRKAGWEPECEEHFFGPLYRATQGPFSTAWLSSWEEVLAWIENKWKMIPFCILFFCALLITFAVLAAVEYLRARGFREIEARKIHLSTPRPLIPRGTRDAILRRIIKRYEQPNKRC